MESYQNHRLGKQLQFVTIPTVRPVKGPFRGIDKDSKDYFLIFSMNIRFYVSDLGHFQGVLESLGSSGRLVGIISIYPGMYPTP